MTETEGDERAVPAGEMDSGRVLALSDGVFAIAATLLVLELRLPENLDAKELSAKLHELLPEFGGYALSYLIIGAVWMSHHRLFRNFTQISGRMARVNLLFLGSVSVLPFVTSLLRFDEPIAPQLYAGAVALIFLLEAVIAWIAHRAGYHRDPLYGRRFPVYALAMGLVFVVSIPLAAIPENGSSIAKYAWLASIPARWVVRLVINRSRRQ